MVTTEERQKRGYELTEEDRVIANVNFLKTEFLKHAYSGTVRGGISKMVTEYQLLAIDILTGRIFVPAIEHALYGRILTDKDKVTLSYYYTQPVPGIIELPPGYEVLPVELIIPEMEKLSAEAIGVIQKTKQELFRPVIPSVNDALRKNTDPKVIGALATIMAKVRAA